MRTIKLLVALFLVSFFAIDTNAQEDDERYAIQIATFGSWEEFAKKKEDFDSHVAVYGEQVGKLVKVYLLNYNSEYEMNELFYPGEHFNSIYEWVKKDYPGAFRRSDVKKENLTYGWDVFEKYKNDEPLPDEFDTKGVGSGTASTETSSEGKYKIQLGVFKEEKHLDHIAEKYGLDENEKGMVEVLLSHDFTKVKKVICRRYYFGEYSTKEKALAKKKELEKNSKRKLLLVKR